MPPPQQRRRRHIVYVSVVGMSFYELNSVKTGNMNVDRMLLNHNLGKLRIKLALCGADILCGERVKSETLCVLDTLFTAAAGFILGHNFLYGFGNNLFHRVN